MRFRMRDVHMLCANDQSSVLIQQTSCSKRIVPLTVDNAQDVRRYWSPARSPKGWRLIQRRRPVVRYSQGIDLTVCEMAICREICTGPSFSFARTIIDNLGWSALPWTMDQSTTRRKQLRGCFFCVVWPIITVAWPINCCMAPVTVLWPITVAWPISSFMACSRFYDRS